jgi:hypothetical protein
MKNELSFSIELSNRTIDLQALQKHDKQEWVHALQAIIDIRNNFFTINDSLVN